ncbi:hypothetical protein CHLRE_08g382350v5 [Chlamydomonas reinhardtii]|uniref:Phosphate translocator protein n=1 Tax=Chlamydomonas reinhardtii TaxID=3055 RepID=A2PZC5_CHLRE|nr:uncharacterized protein CHLRE_08g382350v5 [Chlamydomonas reinhardtii]PNW80203.1 hypothetical protein CHLRE_08g382350v5 [Chlamydomonas reinhardtii]BAF46287.1 phosphate translocator protein [Chlamydomonas reinhardtii]
MLPKDPAAQAKVLREVIRSYTYVLMWMGVSIAVILFNKWLLAYSGFPFPIALTLWHMFFCSTVGFICVRVLKLVKSHNMTPREYYTRVMPIGLLYAGSLWLSNSAYLYLSVSFIQMTKSLMPGLVYASGVMLGTEKYSRGVTLNMLLIAFGVVICAIGEMNLVFRGVVQQLTALGFEAMRLTMVQVLINSKGYNMNPIQSLYYVSPACLICLLVPFLSVELNKLRTTHDWTFNPSVMLANALTAFILNLAVFLLIGKTSALTMNIAGVIKDWMLIFFSFYLFKAPVTTINLLGYAFCCSGVVVYNHMKLQMIKNKVAATGGGKGDEEKPKDSERSKEDILSEIRRLQSQMAELEDRVSNSAKVMNGAGGMGAMAGGGPVGGVNVGLTSPTERTTTEVVISAAAVASNAGGSSEPTEKGNKDN